MERKTLLAIVLSICVLVLFYAVQGIFFSPPEPQQDTSTPVAPPQTPAGEAVQQTTPAQDRPAETTASVSRSSGFEAVLDDGLEEYFTAENPVIETALVRAVFTKQGGDLVSWKLMEHKDKDAPVEMVLSGFGAGEPNAFTVALGGKKLTDTFKVTEYKADEYIEFSKKFRIIGNDEESENEQQIFTLKKRYEFQPDEYMCRLVVTVEGQGAVSVFESNGFAYTLSFGPQIGPRFDKLDGREDFRQFVTYDGKVNTINTPDRIRNNPRWAAIAGKYFTFIACPNIGNRFELDFIQEEKRDAEVTVESRMNIYRPVWSETLEKIEDTYFFYLGPKSQAVLNKYNTGQNGFGMSDWNISQIARSGGFLSPVESVLKWMLEILQIVVRNWGIAIILLTLIVKILFFPLTKKSSMATLRMQAVAPKIKELQAKYKDNRQKLNAEMAELYKKEGYNPLSGCLPMLLQIPIFFAMYSLFNNHFDLRGAMFIPGWIPDLSQPEGWQLSFSIPLIGDYLRLLPFIYVGSQLIYGKVTQVPNQQSTTQTKIMLYVMPIAFFFILYNVPSGLLVYWIFSNIFTLVQQIIIQKYILPKQAGKTSDAAPVIAPNKKKKQWR